MAIEKNTTNVAFKAGLQGNYDKLTSRQEGTFYVTTDTHRLYLGNDLLSQAIITVDSIASLPSGDKVSEGQFYYVKATNDPGATNTHGGNILCVYTNGAWVQINPDTNTNDNDKVTAASIVKKEINEAGNLIYSVTLTRTGVDGEEIDPVTTEFVIAKEDIATLGGIEVDVGSSAVDGDGKVTVATSGAGSAGDGFVIEPGQNISLAGSTAGNIKISAVDTTYDVDVNVAENVASVRLLEDGGEKTAISFVGDSSYITVSGSADDDKITISHNVKSGLPTDAKGRTAAVTGTKDAGATFKVPSVTVDAAGHVTALSESEISIAASKSYEITEITANNSGDLSVTLKDEGGEGDPVVGEGVLYNTIKLYDANGNLVDAAGAALGEGKSAAKIFNQGELGSFYTKAAIDAKFKGIDAMTYKGTVGTNGTVETLPTTGVHIGDTYKVTELSGYNSGDILIANGTEGDDGVISGTITWDRVESGNIDTQYQMSVANNVIALNTTNSQEAGSVEIVGGTALTASTADGKITIDHDSVLGSAVAAIGEDASPANGGTFTIPVIAADAQGHVTSLTTGTITLPTIPSLGLDADSANKKITLKDSASADHGSVQFIEGTGIDVAVAVTGEGIEDVSTVTITHENVTRTDTTPAEGETTAVAFGESLAVVTGIASNSQGHVTGVTVQNLKLPANPIAGMAFSGAAVAAKEVTGGTGVTISESLKVDGADYGSSSLDVSSTSLKIAAGTNAYSVDLVWDTF